MGERLIIAPVSAAAGDRLLEDQALLCEGGRILELLPAERAGAGILGERVDGRGRYLVPGYIDLHIHGHGGRLADRGREDIEAISRELPRRGVTGFLPTLTPQDDEEAALAALAGAESPGAEILGFFLEGHFLALTGAIRSLRPDYSLRRVEGLKKALGGRRGIFGVSPEIPGIRSLLPLMTEGGTPAFITHTGAGYEETERAIDAGARHATHFYDVFPYPGEQEPGVRGCGAVEALLARPEASVDFILDGEHVHPGAVKMALACKGPRKVCLISDANLNAGMEPGVYLGISGTRVVMSYPGGPAREYRGEGRAPGGLVGSGLTLDLAVKNAVRLLGLSLPEAVNLASANPAGVLGLDHERGRIAPGFRADFSLLEQDLSVGACYVGGKRRFPPD
jgi:N-acetylglucosamine-6-phosphate deacetylase